MVSVLHILLGQRKRGENDFIVEKCIYIVKVGVMKRLLKIIEKLTERLDILNTDWDYCEYS